MLTLAHPKKKIALQELVTELFWILEKGIKIIWQQYFFQMLVISVIINFNIHRMIFKIAQESKFLCLR